MKWFFDAIVALISLMILCIPMLIISLLIKLTSRGPVLYWSDRVGKGNAIFKMPKFRTMKADTPQVATHLLENPDQFLTKAGKFLRKSSLDELPQLWSVLKGDMSFVGPRPALFNQDDLIALRTEKNVHRLSEKPGTAPDYFLPSAFSLSSAPISKSCPHNFSTRKKGAAPHFS